MSYSALSVPEVALNSIRVDFGENLALRDVCLDVAKGESLVLIGPSASGKTVALKVIAGLIRPMEGSIRIRGQEMIDLKKNERENIARIGMLFQRSALFDSLTVWENITFRLRQNRRINDQDAIDLSVSKLERVGLTADVAFLYPAELSGGMQKRVGIARALADEPQILLLDEPTAGLDPIMTNVINELILENMRALGATVVSVTSNLHSARHVADRIVMLHEGRIVWAGNVDELDSSDDPYINQFLHKTPGGPISVGFPAH